MKKSRSSREKGKRSAEDWVLIAKQFGEECLVIQKDSKISHDEKWEKQNVLAKKMASEIKNDGYLKEEDKRQMIDSINNYMDEWKVLYDTLHKVNA